MAIVIVLWRVPAWAGETDGNSQDEEGSWVMLRFDVAEGVEDGRAEISGNVTVSFEGIVFRCDKAVYTWEPEEGPEGAHIPLTLTIPGEFTVEHRGLDIHASGSDLQYNFTSQQGEFSKFAGTAGALEHYLGREMEFYGSVPPVNIRADKMEFGRRDDAEGGFARFESVVIFLGEGDNRNYTFTVSEMTYRRTHATPMGIYQFRKLALYVRGVRIASWPSYCYDSRPRKGQVRKSVGFGYNRDFGFNVDGRVTYQLDYHSRIGFRGSYWSEERVFPEGRFEYESGSFRLQAFTGDRLTRTDFRDVGRHYIPVHRSAEGKLLYRTSAFRDTFALDFSAEGGKYRETGRMQDFAPGIVEDTTLRKIEADRIQGRVDLTSRYFPLGGDSLFLQFGGGSWWAWYEDLEVIDAPGGDIGSPIEGGYSGIDGWGALLLKVPGKIRLRGEFYRGSRDNLSPFLFDRWEESKELRGELDVPFSRDWSLAVRARYEILADERLEELIGASDGRMEELLVMVSRNYQDLGVFFGYDFAGGGVKVFAGLPGGF
jgi:hypothetical protein